ncbi:MAG TPA: ABC transporter permease [Candidatus Caenarcaniphilales bacterium]|nr:ABC transporter permease [Candidatus Caenarcaniphilales bacterium]
MSVFVHGATDNPQQAAAWDARRVLAVNLRSILGRAYPRIIGGVREPSWLFFEILLPFLTTSAFVFVYRALNAPQEFVGFVVLGGAMLAFWLNVMWLMAAQLYWERDQGNLELYFTSPVSMMSVLFGMALGGLLMSSIRAGVVLLVGAVLYEVAFTVEQWALLLAVFLLTLAALYGLGMVLASLFLLWGREAWHMTQLLQEPVYFVSGLNFPVGRLGFLGALAVATVPLAVGLDAMRQLAFADSAATVGVLSPVVEALVLVTMATLFIGLARLLLTVIERRARQEGKLTMKGS